MKQRIETLDGLRFLAAIGVLWIHTWTIFGNPRFFIWKIDLANILAIGGNGVDLFFVISGFCMYYFYGSKSSFSITDFISFLKKRWLRLSPAFYFATIIYILEKKFILHRNINIIGNFFHSFFYLNYLFGKSFTAEHFWTLTVEWQFYFLIAILIFLQLRLGFIKAFIWTFLSSIIISLILIIIFKSHSDRLGGTILFRGVEFGFGVIVAKLLLSGFKISNFRFLWLIFFLIITYLGRFMISKRVLDLSIDYANFFRLIGFTIMSFGFSGIMFLSITSQKFLKYILGNNFFKTMGKISYSFYLWHAMIFQLVYFYFDKNFNYIKGIEAPLIAALLSAILLFPISLISYKYLEEPFLKIKKSLEK